MKLINLKSKFPNSNFSWQQDLKEITKNLKNWFFVGGCVRDSLLDLKKPTDIDITTTMMPSEIQKAMQNYKTVTIGKKFGTIGVFFKKYKIEITTTRMDIKHYGRKADVQFGASFFEDSCRRDFTINALLFNKTIVDYHKGIEDLKNGRVRFIGDAQERIKEDYLRILRYVRFFLKFEKSENISYVEEIKSQLDGLSFVSIERILSEWEKMFEINSDKTIRYMNFLGIPQKLFKENFSKPLCIFTNANKNFAHSIFHWKNCKKLPLNKKIKLIINLHHDKCKDFLVNCAWIWYRKGEKSLNDFLDLKKSKGEECIIQNIDQFEKPNLSSFIGIERGQAEIAARYLFLQKERFSLEKLEIAINYIKSQLK